MYDSFNEQSLHGTAMGIITWGIYCGYGLSFVVGTYVPPLDILGQVSLFIYLLFC